MGIEEVAGIISRISTGFEEACMRCLEEHRDAVLDVVKEQLYSGRTGDGQYLSPTYDDDPFFEEEGFWHHRARDYKAWKYKITPPAPGAMLGLEPRPENVPNLFISGKFYSEITISRKDYVLYIDPGIGRGPELVAKYGDQILTLSPEAVEYINRVFLVPGIEDFFKDCGYK